MSPVWRWKALGSLFHARAMQRQGSEGAASHYEQRTAFGKTYSPRDSSVSPPALIAVGLVPSGLGGWVGLAGWVVAALLAPARQSLGRAGCSTCWSSSTTLPGAFFLAQSWF